MGFLAPKVKKSDGPPAEDATKIAKAEDRKRKRAQESFSQRQANIGPVQLKAPNLRM